MTDAVLFIGARRGALVAAARLGLEALVVADAAPAGGPRPRALVRTPPGEVDAQVAAASELVRAHPGRVRAVVAVTEAAVVPAARVREMLELPGLPFDVAVRFTDKRIMKRAAEDAGIPVTPWRELGPEDTAEELVRSLGLPIVLKLPRSSGSRGQVVARNLDEVRQALPQAALAERFVQGREMSVESLVAEGELVFSNPTEYLVPLHASIVAAPPDPESWAAARELSRRVLETFRFERGLAHLELYLTEAGPVLGEVAARPPGGRLMPLLRRAYGFDAWEALLRIELGEHPDLPNTPQRCAGAWMLHPGAGLVTSIEGLTEARAVPGITKVRVRVSEGDRIDTRLGSGQDIGYLQAEGKDRNAVAAALVEAQRLLHVELDAP